MSSDVGCSISTTMAIKYLCRQEESSQQLQGTTYIEILFPLTISSAYPIEGSRRGTSEQRAKIWGKVINANVLIFHVPPCTNVSEATRTETWNKIKNGLNRNIKNGI